MSEGSHHTSLSPNSTRHTHYQNLQQQCKMDNSSRGWSGSTSRGWVQCSRFQTKTQVKVVAEEPSCSCKPMSSSLSSSAMKDKDKRHFFLLGEPLASGIFSFKRQQQQQTTNGSSCANNCPTTRLKYLCPSISFFFTFFSLSCPSCHYSLRKSNSSSGSTWTERKRRGMKWSHKYIASSVSVPLLLLLILAEIITVSVGTTITTPTQKYNGAAFQTHRKYEEKLDYVDYQRNTNNSNHSVFRENNQNDNSDRMFDSRSSRGGDWDHVDDNDVYSNNGTDTISSSLLKFGFSSEQDSPPNHHNNKFESGEEKMASHLQGNHEAVMMMPIPFMKSQKLSSHPEDQQQPSETLARVTNDTLFSGENISNNNNGDGAFLSKSKNKKNNNKNNYIDDDGSTTNGSIKTTGKCWSVVLFEGKTETPPSSSPSLGFGAFAEPLKKPISILCNGTNQLEATLDQIPENLVSQVISIDVKDSSISRLNLTLFHRFPRLESLSVTHSNVTHVIGTCPSGLKALNISFNVLRKVDSSVFLVSETKRDNYEEGELTDAHYGDNGETNFSSKSVSSFTSTSFSSPSSSSSTTAATFSSRSKSDSLPSPPAKISLPSRFNAAHNPESSSAPITSPSSKQMRESRSFETKHGDSAGNKEILQRKSKTSSSSELIEAAENTNESNDNDGLTPQDIYSSKRSRDIKNQDETMTFSSIRTTHLATASASDGSISDSEKSESYSYEEEGNDGGDYYQRGSLAHIATTMAGNTKNGRKDNKGNEIQDTSTSSDGVTQIRSLKGSALQDIDLSHNKISEIPSVILDFQGLKSLRLSGNQLKCDFVWEILADWYMKLEDPNILKDGDETSCGVVDDVRVFHYTVLGVVKAKKDVVETCRTVDKSICHDCSLYSLNKHAGNGYNLSHQSAHGNVAIALKLDCSFQNLTDLPEVPPQTWQLNISGNLIKDLSSLKEPMYENLLILDADSNEITTLDGLAGTSFLDRYNYLSLQNNRFPVIPSNVLSTLKNMRGQGVTFLGANFLECDCDVVKEIKPLLLENSKQIKDLKEIYCKDMKTQSGESYVAVRDLQYTDLCYMDTEESNEMYLYILITVEIILILVIVAKVWHDQRTFRRTRILPWCSAKMPRLPCDAILESVKEPPHFNRSSSTNVRSFACEPPSQSLSSHVQLREVRSNSGQSEKSSQISQLSSFPSSSRTSSV